MNKLIWLLFALMAACAGCSSDTAPTRHNDFTPLTSISIVPVAPTIAVGTSTPLTVIGNYSGLFTRDITDQTTWSSAAPAVADFALPASPSRVKALAPGSADLTATVGTLTTTATLTVSSATVTAITITPANPSLAKGLQQQFTASGTFSDSTNQDLTYDATWSSNSPVATVSNAIASKGLAQAVAVGTATISASFGTGGRIGTTLLTVTPAVLQSIAITPANPSVLSISKTTFTATGSYSDQTSLDITSQVSWTSSLPAFATIAATSSVATTLTQGTTVISATLSGINGQTNLKVTGGNLSSIAIAPLTPKLVKDTDVRMSATGSFTNGTLRDISSAVTWEVANRTSAAVSIPVGNLVWLSGKAVTDAAAPNAVTASYNGNPTISTNLTVVAPALNVNGLTIEPASLSLIAGTGGRLAVTAAFNGTSQDVTLNCAWSSTNSSVATVGDSGLTKGRVSGVAAGSTTIRADYSGQFITIPVTVTTPVLLNLALSPGPATVTAGNQVKFTATASYNGTPVDVTEDATWSLDKLSVAILADPASQPGQVVAVDSGSATLTATFGGKNASATVTVP